MVEGRVMGPTGWGMLLLLGHGCVGEGEPDGLVLPTGTLAVDQPWVLGGDGLALTASLAAEDEPAVPVVVHDEHLLVEHRDWSAVRPADVPAGVLLKGKRGSRRNAPAVVLEHAVSSRASLEISVGVRTRGLIPGPRAGGAAFVVEEVDADGERVDLHDGQQRLSGDTDWRTQHLRITPRSKTGASDPSRTRQRAR